MRFAPSFLPWLRPFWTRDVAATFLLAAALYFIKEWYPFSHFPMYSRLEPQATLVFVTDQDDRPVALRTTFRYASSDSKKAFNARLEAAASRQGRRWTEGHPDDMRAAGAAMLDFLSARAFAGTLSGATELRFHHRTLEWRDGAFREQDQWLATKPLP